MAEENTEGERLMVVPGVCVYEIKDEVKKLIIKGEMEVLLVLRHQTFGADQYVCFCRIGDKVAPLSKDVPAMRMDRVNYVFPVPGNKFYGVTFPSYTTDGNLAKFEEVLETYATFQQVSHKRDDADGTVAVQHEDETASALGGAAKAVTSGSRFVATTLVRGAGVLGRGIGRGTAVVKQKVKPRSEAVHVSDKTRENVQKVKHLSGAAVTLSSSLVTGVSAMIGQLSRSVADELKQTEKGRAVVTSSPGSKTHAAAELGHATLDGGIAVWDALFDAGQILIHSVAEGTAEVVEHRYGEEVGDVSKTIASAVDDLATATHNMAKIEPAHMAAQAAKGTAKEMLDNPSGPNPAIE